MINGLKFFYSPGHYIRVRHPDVMTNSLNLFKGENKTTKNTRVVVTRVQKKYRAVKLCTVKCTVPQLPNHKQSLHHYSYVKLKHETKLCTQKSKLGKSSSARCSDSNTVYGWREEGETYLSVVRSETDFTSTWNCYSLLTPLLYSVTPFCDNMYPNSPAPNWGREAIVPKVCM